MIAVAGVLLTYALHSVAFGLVAVLAARCLTTSAAFRCTIWKVALLAPLLTSGFVLVWGRADMLSLSSAARQVFPIPHATVEVDVREVRGQPSSRIERVRDPAGAATAGVFIALALVGTSRAALFLVYRWLFVRRLRNDATAKTLSHPVLCGITALETNLVEIPVALASGVIAVPAGFASDGSERSRRAILLHERSHVERRDPVWIDFARFVSALTVWQPLNRIVVDRLERDVELAADARALELGAEPLGLLEGLAQFASRALSPSPAGASLVRAESPLVQRANAALLQARQQTPRLARLCAIGVFLLLASAMSGSPGVTPGGDGSRGISPQGVEVREIDVKREQPVR